MALRVLIVSDGQTPWAEVLKPEQLETRTVHSCEIAADIDAAQVYDLIIVDLENADREIELCRKIRTVFEGALLLCSTHTGDKYQLSAYAAGVDEFLILPQPSTVLRMKIRAWRRTLLTRLI